jgi:hypothetical protein
MVVALRLSKSLKQAQRSLEAGSNVERILCTVDHEETVAVSDSSYDLDVLCFFKRNKEGRIERVSDKVDIIVQ